MKNLLAIAALCLAATLAPAQQRCQPVVPTGDTIAVVKAQMTLSNYAPYTMHLLQEQYVTPGALACGAGRLVLETDATGYFFNAEYPMPFATSYSVPGFRLAPVLSYGINDRARLRAGMTLSAFAGSDSLHGLRPVLSLIYQPADWLQLTVGTLYGASFHRLPPPLYNPDNWVYDYSENGVQILTDTRGWNSDTWINWTHFLEPGGPEQETFTFGTRHELLVLGRRCPWLAPNANYAMPLLVAPAFSGEGHGWMLTLPAVFMANHHGGSFTSTPIAAYTSFNERAGLALHRVDGYDLCARNRFVWIRHHWTLDLSAYAHHRSDVPMDSAGLGFFPMLTYEWQRLDREEQRGVALRASLGYWSADRFYDSELGAPQYRPHRELDASRRMLVATLAAEHEYKSLNLGLNFTFYHDLDERRTDSLFGFYMRFRGHARLH